MKRFRSLTIILAAVSAALLVAAGIGSAIAYFTTYAEAQGTRVVNFSHREEITEEVGELSKAITITNQADSQPVYVRARAYTGAQYASRLQTSGTGWEDGGDGWWYYSQVLNPGASTASPLNVQLTGITEEESKDGEELNIAVVYESALVIYEYNKNADGYVPVTDWSKIFDSGKIEDAKGGAQS